MQQISIIIRDDNFMRIQTPLSFAYDFAQRGVRVDALFLSMALRVLTKSGVDSLTVDGRHADEEAWLRERLVSVGVPADMHDSLREIKNAGEVCFFGCQATAAVLELTEADLIPEAAGLIDSTDFITRAVDSGGPCMYF